MAWQRSPAKLTGIAQTMLKNYKKYRGAQDRVVHPFYTFLTHGDNHKAQAESRHSVARWRSLLGQHKRQWEITKKYQSAQYRVAHSFCTFPTHRDNRNLVTNTPAKLK
jgi:hypothetical protein